jgi:hypothetical protein
MKEKLNIYTCCNGLYNEFIPLFILSHLYYNSEAFVEVGYDGDLSDNVKKCITYLSEKYTDRFLISKIDVGLIKYKDKIINCSPNLTRFIEEPKTKSNYIYISDVDIICLQKNILSIHLDDMKKTGLPYSNIVRDKVSEEQSNRRLTGLHFSPFEEYYPLPYYEDLIDRKLQNHDEVFLYEIVKKRFPNFNYDNNFRPVHGIHVSLNREPTGKLNWGISRWINEWKIFRSTEDFLEMELILSDLIKRIINQIDINVK